MIRWRNWFEKRERILYEWSKNYVKNGVIDVSMLSMIEREWKIIKYNLELLRLLKNIVGEGKEKLDLVREWKLNAFIDRAFSRR